MASQFNPFITDEQNQRSLLDGVDEPAILLSLDYRILRVNESYQQRFPGLTGIVGRKCHEVSHNSPEPCWKRGERCPMLLVKHHAEPHRVLHIHHTPQGDEYADVEGRPVFDEHQHLAGFMEVIHHAHVASPVASSNGLVGRSEAFNRMLAMVRRVACSDSTALLLGESGTGKELVARAIHDLSAHRENLFVPVECSGLTESLFESELFGHERGAFTGAVNSKQGLVELARGGTLFLDEIGDIPPALQVKLLRLLETGCYRRVGGVETRQTEFRLVCATHQDLSRMVDEGRFRKDLYYRISVFPLQLPPLRERREDIPLLVDSLLLRIGQGAERMRFSPEAMACLQRYAFPGNVRELRNILERAALLTDGQEIRLDALPDICQEGLPPSNEDDTGIQTLVEVERCYLERVSTNFTGDRRELARLLGISERTLFRKLRLLQPKKTE